MRNGYAVLAAKSDRAAVEAAVEAKRDVSAEMSGLEPWLAENDAVVAATAAGIKFAAQAGGEALEKSKKDLAGAAEFAALRSYLDLYGQALAAMPGEISLAVAGVLCDPQGSIRIVGRARLVRGGLVSQVVAGIPPVSEKLLAGALGGPFVFAAGGVGVPKLIDGYLGLVSSFMSGMKALYGMSAEDMERMGKDSLEAFRQVRAMNFVMKTGRQGDPIYSNMFCVLRVENSRRVLDLQEKYAENTGKLLKNAKEGILKSIAGKRLEIAGRPALQHEMTFDLSSLPGADANRVMLDEVLGIGGKVVLYQVAADEHTLLMGIGVSPERMAAALDVLKQPRKSLAEDANVSATAALLPADAQWVAYLSPRGYMQTTMRLMEAVMKSNPAAAGIVMPQFPQFPKSPPIGVAVKAESSELRGEIAVPAAMLQAAGQYTKDMQQMFMNRATEQPPPPAP